MHGLLARRKRHPQRKVSEFIRELSPELFWDVDPETIDEQPHRRYVIRRVLERGELSDLRKMIAFYTMPVVISEAQQMRSLDPMTLAFAACLGNVKEETFRCYRQTFGAEKIKEKYPFPAVGWGCP